MKTKFCPHCSHSHICIPTPSKSNEVPRRLGGDVRLFVQEMCDVDFGLKCRGGELYEAYKSWARHEASVPMAPQWFSRAIRGEGFKRSVSGSVTYYGLRPKV